MTARKTYLTGFAALLALSVAGCNAGDSVGAVAEKLAPTPKQQLLDAVPDEKDSVYRFDVKGGETPMSGVLDVPNKAVEVKFVESDEDFTLTMSFLMVGEKAWTRIAFKPADLPGLPKFGKKWLLLDEGKLADKELLKAPSEADPGNTGVLVFNATEVTETGAGRYTGTTDLQKSAEAEIVDAETLTALGEQARTVPFEATVDREGHLSTLTVKIPAAGTAKAQTYQVSYTGFGKTPTPEAPAAGAQQKASAQVYEMLNG
ncbi:hypothetical protein [Paractinoplanes rishiriensis]|uniref:Lipoprotein n=1 Tax=Paractinoplanes rishiriensis TaxID=1050105 RepID=A0A919K7U8_9ACTN|nr:hypothetical protein [Actinoplanes rishiriensis]GIF00295.1 hypothetical protein Ari01nite_77590 [Actinoplanes rishiriensis]